MKRELIIPDGWELIKLGDYFEFKNGINFGKNENGFEIEVLGVGDFKDKFYADFSNLSIHHVNSTKNMTKIEKGDLLFVRSNGNKELIGRVLFVKNINRDIYYSGFVIKGSCNQEKMHNEYIARFCSSFYVMKQYLIKGGGSNINNLSQAILSDVDVLLPPYNEQQKLNNILLTWDKAIELKEKLIEEKKKQKNVLMKKLLTGKVRLPRFDGETKLTEIGKFIKECNSRNKDKLETRVLSVTNKQGFILQEEQFDRIVASKDLSNYKVVHKNQFAYNPSRVNVGSIDLLLNFDSGLLSPMYVVFECKEGLDTDYLYHFLKSEMFLNIIPNLLQGSVRDSLSFDSLKLVKLFIPSLHEQKEIATRLNTATKEITLLKQELQALTLQKKALSKLLLTGVVRAPQPK